MARKKLELKTELKYFNKIKDGLLPEHSGKFALVKGEKLIGVYKTAKNAYLAGLKKMGAKQFLIKEVLEKENVEYIPTFSHNLIRASL